jgi:hypothetical protein
MPDRTPIEIQIPVTMPNLNIQDILNNIENSRDLHSSRQSLKEIDMRKIIVFKGKAHKLVKKNKRRIKIRGEH